MSKNNVNGAQSLKHILNIQLLKSFLHPSGAIKSGICLRSSVKQQKLLTKIVKRARFLGLIKTSYI